MSIIKLWTVCERSLLTEAKEAYGTRCQTRGREPETIWMQDSEIRGHSLYLYGPSGLVAEFSMLLNGECEEQGDQLGRLLYPEEMA